MSLSTRNSPGARTESPVGRQTVRETGRVSDRAPHTSTHANQRSACSLRPTPEGPERDNYIAGPRTGTTRSGFSAPASAAASARHNEPGSRPASACPTQPPSKAGGASPRGGERHHGVGKSDQSTESDCAGRGAAHHPGPPGMPERHAAGHNQRTRTGAKQRRPPGGAKQGSVHTTRRTTAQEQLPGNTKPTHHKPKPGEAGYKRSLHTSTHTPRHPSQEWRGAAETHARTAHPSQEWWGTSGARTRTPYHPCQEWQGAAEAGAEAHPSTPRTPARSGGAEAERAHKQAHPNSPARRGGAQPKSGPKHIHPHRTPQPGVAGYKRSAHMHTPTPHPGVAGRSRSRSPSVPTWTAHSSQAWQGTIKARTRTHTHGTP